MSYIGRGKLAENEHLRPSLVMRRDNLDNIPKFELPPGYHVRTYRDGDQQAWCDILNESFEDSWTIEKFTEKMLQSYGYRPGRIFFMYYGDDPVATASAWRMKSIGDDTIGYVHWVAVKPAHRGKGLGRAASIVVLEKFREEGCREAVLQTDDYRLPALKTYLNLDFHPLLVDENQRERWRKIFQNLGLPELIDKFSCNLSGPVSDFLQRL